MCARHIYANWRKKFKQKKYQKLFWRCAKSSSMSLFNYNLGILREKTLAGADAILRQDPHHWSRAWFKLGHNRSTCEKRTCSTSRSTRQSTPPPFGSVPRQLAPPPTDSVPKQSAALSKFQDVVHTSRQSSTSNQKRKSTTTTSTKSKKSKTHCSELGIVHSEKTGATIQNVSHPSALFLIN